MAALSTQDIDYARANLGDPYALGAWQRQKGFTASDLAGAFGWEEVNNYMGQHGALLNSGYAGTQLTPAQRAQPVETAQDMYQRNYALMGQNATAGNPTNLTGPWGVDTPANAPTHAQLNPPKPRPPTTGNALSNFGPPMSGGYGPMAGAGGGNALSFGGGSGGGSMYQNNRRGY